jgi:hypothetical protein
LILFDTFGLDAMYFASSLRIPGVFYIIADSGQPSSCIDVSAPG